jgi:uncharacterized protein
MLKPIMVLLVLIGGINWGLIGIFDFNFVHFVFGKLWIFEQIVYVVVGICSLLSIPTFFASCKKS